MTSALSTLMSGGDREYAAKLDAAFFPDGMPARSYQRRAKKTAVYAAKYPATCGSCARPIAKGDPIFKLGNLFHEDCNMVETPAPAMRVKPSLI